MTIIVKYQPTTDVLTKIRGSLAIHSRFNRKHFDHCTPCYEDYLDFVEQCRIDEIEETEE